MKFNNSVIALAAALFGNFTLGHLLIKSPVPFGIDSLNNSPLVDAAPGSSTSDWPCKQRIGVYDITSMNYMKVGDPQLLQLTGSATHGGGTMQLAYTKDFNPTADSEFKLFQTFQGDAPADATGSPTPKEFTFILPTGTPNGNLTFAWIWYNRIGNREIYMNCAPLAVSGGSDTDDYYNSLPNAYIINLPTSECGSQDSKDVEIPVPGQYISKGSDTSYWATATGSGCAAAAAAQTKGVVGLKTNIVSNGAADKAPATNGDSTGPAPTGAAASPSAAGGAGAASSSQPMASQPAMTSAVPTAQASASGGEIGNSATVSATSMVAPAPAYSATSPSAAASSAATSSTYALSSAAGVAAPSGAAGAASPSGTASSSSSTGTCSTSGAIVCNGPNLFGLCNSGSVVWQPVAAGTTCTNGQVVKRSVIRHAHVRRHVQNAGKYF